MKPHGTLLSLASLIQGWKQSDKQPREKYAASSKLISHPLREFRNIKGTFLTEWNVFWTNTRRFHTQKSTIHPPHQTHTHTHNKRLHCGLTRRTCSSPIWLRWFTWFEIRNGCCRAEMLQENKNINEAVSDWVAMFNTGNNPQEHRYGTFLICTTLNLCQSCWRVHTSQSMGIHQKKCVISLSP